MPIVSFSPIFFKNADTIVAGSKVTLSTPADGAVIYYEAITDGSAATITAENYGDYTEYTGPITVNVDTTFYAVTTKNGKASEVSSAVYTVEVIPENSIRNYDASSSVTNYTVSTVKDLVKLAELVNGGNKLAGVTITQKADIKFNDRVLGDDWSAPLEASAGQPNADLLVFDGIGNKNTTFSGTYDGQGYKIEGVYVYGAHQYLGFFGYTSGATLKNIVIIDACVVNAATDSNCDDRFGGLIGVIKDSTTVNDCIFVGTVGSEEAKARDTYLEYVGGLAGRSDASGSTATDCIIAANIIAEGNSSENAPIIGYKAANLTCTNVVGYTPATYDDAARTAIADKAAALAAARQ